MLHNSLRPSTAHCEVILPLVQYPTQKESDYRNLSILFGGHEKTEREMNLLIYGQDLQTWDAI